MEVAKMRAARLLWAKLVQQFGPTNDKSLSPASPLTVRVIRARS
jgi:methylmalonyl-CoA mutase N-terminal domain/subunit